RDDLVTGVQTCALPIYGIPPEIVTALRAVSAGFRAWGSSVQVTRPLADGAQLELSKRKLRVLHRPGHSPSDTVFFDEARGILLADRKSTRLNSSHQIIS